MLSVRAGNGTKSCVWLQPISWDKPGRNRAFLCFQGCAAPAERYRALWTLSEVRGSAAVPVLCAAVAVNDPPSRAEHVERAVQLPGQELCSAALGQSWQSSWAELAAGLGSLCEPLQVTEPPRSLRSCWCRGCEGVCRLLLSCCACHPGMPTPVVLEKGGTASLCGSRSQFPAVLVCAVQYK